MDIHILDLTIIMEIKTTLKDQRLPQVAHGTMFGEMMVASDPIACLCLNGVDPAKKKSLDQEANRSLSLC